MDNSDNSLKDISDKEHEKEERRKVILGLLGGSGRKDQELPPAEEPSLDDSSEGMPPLVAMKYSELSPTSSRRVLKLIEVGWPDQGKTQFCEEEVLHDAKPL